MANPQIEDGHTQIANEILDHIMTIHLSPNQWQVVICILRKTYGFKKKADYIANCQIANDTKLCKEVISRVLQTLEARKIVTRNGKNIGFNKDWEQWEKLAVSSTNVSSSANKNEQFRQPKLAVSSTNVSSSANYDQNEKLAVSSTKVSNLDGLVSSSANKKLAVVLTTKEKKDTYTKETIQNKDTFVLPEWIEQKTWDAFLEMRKKKKATPTDHAKLLIIKELDKLRQLGDEPKLVLEQSIIRNWTGVFALKNSGGNQNGGYQGNPSQKPAGAFADLE